MLVSALAATVLSLLAAPAASKTVAIDVARHNGAYFQPNYAKADVGDVLEFRFVGEQKHSVAQGNFFTGCYPATKGGFYSGEQESPAIFRVTVNNTDPIVYYSSVKLDCQIGMVGIVNADAIQTITQYTANAKKSVLNSSPDRIFGGVLSKSGSNDDGNDEENENKDSGAGQLYKSVTGVLAAVLVATAAVFGNIE